MTTASITANSIPLPSFPHILTLSYITIAAAGVRTLTDLVKALTAEGLTVEAQPAAVVDRLTAVDAYAPDGRHYMTLFAA